MLCSREQHCANSAKREHSGQHALAFWCRRTSDTNLSPIWGKPRQASARTTCCSGWKTSLTPRRLYISALSAGSASPSVARMSPASSMRWSISSRARGALRPTSLRRASAAAFFA
jgi:hypothetical protein